MIKYQLPYYANDNDAFVPEKWAQESLMILEANMVAANLVHRDFEMEIASFGDVVNTRKPAGFTTKRKATTDSVTDQDATATNVAIRLDQHLYNTFIIYDGEEAKSFENLVQVYLKPAVLALAQTVDEIVLGQVYQFLANHAGKLSTTPTLSSLVSLREVMTNNKCPLEGRNLIISPTTEGHLLGIDSFVEADKVGDAGTAMRTASLGQKLGFNIFTCHNVPSFTTTATTSTTTGASASAGATTFTAAAADSLWESHTGEWFTIAGDMIPHQVTSFDTATNVVTFYPALETAVESGAAVTIYNKSTVNYTAGYDQYYNKLITADTFTTAPSTGQMLTVGTAGASATKYSLLKTPTATQFYLDRSLEAALADAAGLFLGPQGNYNFAFNKNAVSLITRPLPTPISGTGVQSFVANYNGLSMRVTITYSGTEQGHRVTVDMLCGVKVLDTALGAVLFA